MTNTSENIDVNNIDIEDLIELYKTCPDEKKKRMFHLQIVEKCMYLVRKIAGTVSVQSGISTEDLVQVGSIGLIKAIDFFDKEKNTKFKTYMSYFIKGEIKHYLRDKGSIIKAPRELQELVYKITNAVKKFNEEGIEDPTAEQIAAAVNISPKKVHEVMEAEYTKTALSLDQVLTGEDDEITLLDKIPAGDYQEFLKSYENKIMLSSAIYKLPKDLRIIIELSYIADLNQREISEKLGISQMQVSRRIKKALSKMYDIIKTGSEEE
ncbi:sigma-70 family RNA polymerase sigma factor [bacterium]|nr:sigma-70 family RNA polymerase sigma factor [bacterium]